MKIENTAYYVNSTKFFRSGARAGRTAFGDDGFTYISDGIAVGFRRASKSNYEVTVMYDGDVAQIIRHSIADAAEFAARAVLRAEE